MGDHDVEERAGGRYALDDDEDDYGEHDVEEDAPLPTRGEVLDEYDEDDDEEDDEEEDIGKGRSRKRQKVSNPFLDVEAEVDEDDEDDEEEEEDQDFIDREEAEIPDADEYHGTDARARREVDRRLTEKTDAQLADIARDIDRRYKRTAVRRYRGDASAHKSQQSLLPSVTDPKLWMIRCREGKERDIVFMLMRKHFDVARHGRAPPVKLHSVFYRSDLKGFIYVEAEMASHVSEALQGVLGLYLSRMTLVPVKEMTEVLTIKREERSVDLLQKEWVRIKRGKYAGDLARVVDVSEAGDVCTVRLIPRLEFSSSTEAGRAGPGGAAAAAAAEKKRKAAGGAGAGPGGPAKGAAALRPPQKLFNPRDVPPHIARQLSVNQRGYYLLGSDTFKDGYLEKSVKVTALDTEGPPPTLDEINKFAGSDGAIDALTLQNLKLAAASREASQAVFNPGDNVEVTSGELANVPAVILSISGHVATIRPQVASLREKTMVPLAQLRKRFSEGDTVRVVAGKHANTIGNVVHIHNNAATLITANDHQEIQVFTRDLQDAKDAPLVTAAAASGGLANDSKAMDKVSAPTLPGSKAAMGSARPPPVPRGGPSGGAGGFRRRDGLMGSTVKVLGGPFKGYIGVVKNTMADGIVKVELHTNSKTVTIDRNKLSVRDESGQFHGPSSMFGGYGGSMGAGGGEFARPNPGRYTPGGAAFNPGSRTPGSFGASSARTPNPYASAQTPNPYASAQTPNPYASGGVSSFGDDGGRTPAWDAGSRTPYRPMGGASSDDVWGGARTPAYTRSSSYLDDGRNGNSSSAWNGTGSGSSAWGGDRDRDRDRDSYRRSAETPREYAAASDSYGVSSNYSRPSSPKRESSRPPAQEPPAPAAAAPPASDEPEGSTDWAQPQVMVTAPALGAGRAWVIERSAGDGRVDVRDADGGDVKPDIAVHELTPAPPSKKGDKAVVLRGALAGTQCEVMGLRDKSVVVRIGGQTKVFDIAMLGRVSS